MKLLRAFQTMAEVLMLLICVSIGALVCGAGAIILMITLIVSYHWNHVISEELVTAVLTMAALIGGMFGGWIGSKLADVIIRD